MNLFGSERKMNVNSRAYKILQLSATNKVISEKEKCEYAPFIGCC